MAVDEEHDHRHGALHGFMWVFDVTDVGAMKPISTFDVSERDSPYARAGGRFWRTPVPRKSSMTRSFT